jgi:hypothetical protein
MRRAIPFPTARTLTLVLLAAWLTGCSHTGEEERISGYWEGALPLPTTGEQLPIAYDFRPGNGLTVIVGLGEGSTVTEWERWEVHSAEGGNIVIYIHRGDGRVFSTLARHTADGLMLWDLGTEEGTAAHVRRVLRSEEAPVGAAGDGAPPLPDPR